MINVSYFKERFERWQAADPEDPLAVIRLEGFDTFNKTGLPSLRDEEWKYTGISGLFDKEYSQFDEQGVPEINRTDVDAMRLPGYAEASELVFVNGVYSPELSVIRSSEEYLTILPLEEAARGTYSELVEEHLGKSNRYITDGIHALNTSFIYGGIFMRVPKSGDHAHPVYLYHISDVRSQHTLSQPRSLIIVEEGAALQLLETYQSLGTMDSFSNQVMEIVVNAGARLEYYKIQNESPNCNQVSTTHIRQIGRSLVQALTVTLNGGMIRNNLNIVLEAPGNEAHLYGLYLLKGRTHADNHTLVDNRQPDCFSNELYKGIVDDNATAVFNGKILVEARAQKTNAYQSNKNILLSDKASINTKPQLEIFADDVKCSHGCTVGSLDQNAMFYLRARGIPEAEARRMLLQAFAADILDHIRPEPLRKYVKQLISEHLSGDTE